MLLANAGFIALFVLIGVGVVVAAVFAFKAQKKRRLALEAWARAQGFGFEPEHVSSLEHRFAAFDDFTTGDRRYGYNVMRGARGDRGVWAFDYHYQTTTHTKNGTRTHHHHFSAVVLDTGLRLEPLSIRSENFFDKLTQAIGFDDIDFESAEFSRTFHVKSPNKRWAFEVIHQGTMEYLLQAPRYKLKFDGPFVLVRRSGRFRVKEFEEAIEVAEGILDRIPKDIVKRLRT